MGGGWRIVSSGGGAGWWVVDVVPQATRIEFPQSKGLSANDLHSLFAPEKTQTGFAVFVEAILQIPWTLIEYTQFLNALSRTSSSFRNHGWGYWAARINSVFTGHINFQPDALNFSRILSVCLPETLPLSVFRQLHFTVWIPSTRKNKQSIT